MIHWHNIVDALLLGDLAIINGLTFLAYFYSRSGSTLKNENSVNITMSVQLVFIYLPIVLYVTALVLSVCQMHCLPKFQKLRLRSSRSRSGNEMEQNFTSSDQLSTSASVPLEEFPARLLGDDVEYEEFPSNCSPTPENDSY